MVIWHATTMSSNAQSIQLERPHKTTPQQLTRGEAIGGEALSEVPASLEKDAL
jgi:hypothetical protein